MGKKLTEMPKSEQTLFNRTPSFQLDNYRSRKPFLSSSQARNKSSHFPTIRILHPFVWRNMFQQSYLSRNIAHKIVRFISPLKKA